MKIKVAAHGAAYRVVYGYSEIQWLSVGRQPPDCCTQQLSLALTSRNEWVKPHLITDDPMVLHRCGWG